MALLLALGPTIFTQVSCSRSVRVFHEFIKYTTIPEVDLGLYLCTNMFGVSHGLDMLQDDQLKNDYPLGVPHPSLYTAELF